MTTAKTEVFIELQHENYYMKINLRWLGTESYWTSIKIKISMSCVYKKYGIKTKMVQEQ